MWSRAVKRSWTLSDARLAARSSWLVSDDLFLLISLLGHKVFFFHASVLECIHIHLAGKAPRRAGWLAVSRVEREGKCVFLS